jgi:hypothetical protein
LKGTVSKLNKNRDMCSLERETLNEWVGNENVGFYHYSAYQALFSCAVTICLVSYLGQSPAAFFF